MPVTMGTREMEVGLGLEGETAPVVFLGDYMPFVGVRYYAIFDEQDIAEGRTKIGLVGWRLGRTQVATKGPEPIAA